MERSAVEPRRKRPNLFEVISKAPQVQYPVVRRSFFGRARTAGPRATVPTVAQPLTDAEAAEEMAAGLRAELERRQAKEAKKAEKEAARAAKATAKIEAAKARATATAIPGGSGPMSGSAVQVVRGRLTVSFNAVVSLVAAATVCVLMITAYSVGRRTGGADGGDALVPAAAKPAEYSATPLLPALGSKPKGKTSKSEPPPSADLSRLLEKAVEREPEPGVAANSPTNPAREETADEAAAKLNFLQIESFLITRERSGDVVVKDLEDVRRFLEERGIKTVARRHSNGYVLYSAQGFLPDRENAKQRETFRKRIEALGQEYRRSGGQYEFKGCDFVGYARTKAGQPV